MSSVVGKAGKLFDTHYSSAWRSTNGCCVDKIQVQVQNKSGELGVGGNRVCAFSEVPLQTKIQWTVKFHCLRQTVLNWLVLSWL